jgi:outer membrane receptor protein involved in Fe transport
MGGAPDLLDGKVKAFFHASYESYLGPGFEMPIHLLSTSLPQPNSADLYGPVTRGSPPRSYLINLDGKLTIGKLRLIVQYPISERHTPLTFDGGIVREHIPQDTAIDPETGQPLCPVEPPFGDPGDECADKGRLNRDHRLEFVDRYGVAEYQTRSDSGRHGVTAKAYLVNFQRKIGPFSGGAALKGLLEGGISFTAPIEGYRAGVAVDGDASLEHEVRLLYGIEALHEWQRDVDFGSRQGDGVGTKFAAPVDLSLLPLPCPRTLDADNNMVFIEGCPLTMAFPAARTVFGAYLDATWRPTPQLILDGGARLQVSPSALGNQSYDPTPTLGGALVYRLAPAWNLKLNVAQGFRPPIFNNTTSNGEAIQIDGAEDLKVETATAGQVEINARLFKGDRGIRELSFRADYSYTALHNLIQIVGGSYENTADRGIHSAELLGKLYLQGGHRLELGYTWLKVLTRDAGVHRSLPEHWLNLGAVFALGKTVSATSTLRVIGSMEDPNRMVDTRQLGYDELGNVVRRDDGMDASVSSAPHELVLDRLPAVADLSLGLTWGPTAHLTLEATVHNTFDERYYQPDAFFSYEPRIEFLPNPAEDFRAYASATYRY